MTTKNRPRPFVGMTVYSVNNGSAARGCEQVATRMIVSRVGRKYFEATAASGFPSHEYRIDTWDQRTEYTPESVLYETEEEFFVEKERSEKVRDIFKAFRYGYSELPIECVREMHAAMMQWRNQ